MPFWRNKLFKAVKAEEKQLKLKAENEAMRERLRCLRQEHTDALVVAVTNSNQNDVL